MKELSIEEKAKAYDEALERAKNTIEVNQTIPDIVECVESLFPELAESEDEKIRKAIGYAIGQSTHSDGTLINGVSSEEALAWLEKQGEHADFLSKIQVGDKVTRNQDGVLVNLSQLKRVAKPAEEYNITGIGSKNAQGKLGEMIKKIKPLEQKPWSEEDKKQARQIERIVSNDGCTQKLQKQIADWLKSLKDRVQPQPKQEWGGGDEAHLHSLITHLEQWIERHPNTTGADIQGENITWLKSLRHQNTWKPSDEQMDVLLSEVTAWTKGCPKQIVLESLYQDLKKLREE